MLQMKVTIVDADKVIKALKKLDEDTQTAARMFMLKEGADMESEIKRSMPIGGIIGKGPKGGTLRRHSAPGQVPFVQHGNLRGSVGYLLSIVKNTFFLANNLSP